MTNNSDNIIILYCAIIGAIYYLKNLFKIDISLCYKQIKNIFSKFINRILLFILTLKTRKEKIYDNVKKSRKDKFRKKYDHEYCLTDKIYGYEFEILKLLSEKTITVSANDEIIFEADISDFKDYLLSLEYSKHTYISEDMIITLLKLATFKISFLMSEDVQNKHILLNKICKDFNQINPLTEQIKKWTELMKSINKINITIPPFTPPAVYLP